MFNRNILYVFLAITAFYVGCSHENTIKLNDYKKEAFNIKIGLLGDSQITTEKGAFNYGMRRKAADRISKVAIRPTALEYLSLEMLDMFLSKLKKVNIIFYLGDGANSGCKDELDKVFGVLKNFRHNNEIPIYYLIGNHDYLGTGNQTRYDIRENLCDSGCDNECGNGFNFNPPETKEEVIKRIDNFNKLSEKIDKNFSYSITPKTVYYKKEIEDKRCNDLKHYYLYYVGVLSSKNNNIPSIEFLLADTSDYRDIDWKPSYNDDRGCEIIGAWGMKGSMSFDVKKTEIPQIKYLADNSNPDVDFRFIVSHYRPYEFNMINPFKYSLSRVKNKLGNLLSNGNNYWLSGHTHTKKPEIEPIKVGPTISKREKR